MKEYEKRRGKDNGYKKRKYSKEQKEEIVKRALSGERILKLRKKNNIFPGLINRRI